MRLNQNGIKKLDRFVKRAAEVSGDLFGLPNPPSEPRIGLYVILMNEQEANKSGAEDPNGSRFRSKTQITTLRLGDSSSTPNWFSHFFQRVNSEETRFITTSDPTEFIDTVRKSDAEMVDLLDQKQQARIARVAAAMNDDEQSDSEQDNESKEDPQDIKGDSEQSDLEQDNKNEDDQDDENEDDQQPDSEQEQKEKTDLAGLLLKLSGKK